MVIARSEDITQLGQLVSPETLEKLRALDYNACFALIVFRGLQGNTGYSVEIERVVRQGYHLSVYAQFRYPQPGGGMNPTMNSPFHVVTVTTGGTWGEEFSLDLYARVASQSHRIP